MGKMILSLGTWDYYTFSNFSKAKDRYKGAQPIFWIFVVSGRGCISA